MKNKITLTDQSLSMNHKEIAEMVGSRIDSVQRTIERLAERGVIQLPPMVDFEEINNLGLAVTREYYNFEGEAGKRDSIVVVAQISPEYTAQLVDHWRALEKEVSHLRTSLQAPLAPQETHMNNDILSLARVIAEATASATLKAVIDIVGIQKYQPVAEPVAVITPPAPETLQINHQAATSEESEYALVSELSWVSGLSDSTCRRLVTFANLPTRLTNGDRGHLQINRESFMRAAQALLDESTPPTGKLKRWQHPEFNGFTLRLKSESHAGEPNEKGI
ncbi:helix-turn-helix domain-containing protein [Yersinia sp. 2105 StPb PI]|uniref:helix-turn-helix domain-containing protein n=1 Tax=Yersinia sp. 2105 StPb PI TaxID=2507058 RepID=UPI000FFB72AA|nr:helix-turn-helix domain-containing protein [Yersinia sp. 2105 StPb PI]RXA96921.1 hypothetical protein EQP49_05950 [Yersinia sp. 2105 StPb PI]